MPELMTIQHTHPAYEPLRRSIIEQIWQAYDFGGNVEDSSGWETVTPEGSFQKPVFLQACNGTSSAWLVVTFEPNSATVTEVYAIDTNGNIFGERCDELATPSVSVH